VPQNPDTFRVETTSREARSVSLVLFGELDLVSMPEFREVLARVLSDHPRELIFDLTTTQFVSVQGFLAIGRTSLVVERVVIRSVSGFPERVMRVLGQENLTFITEPPPEIASQ
jgi:anti-anti-sigma regulatory factor